jgi:hypothetical protein
MMAARLQLLKVNDALPGMQNAVRSERGCLRELRTVAPETRAPSPRRRSVHEKAPRQ